VDAISSTQALTDAERIDRLRLILMAQTPPGYENDPGTGDLPTFKGCRP
jgi:hypothetical protein